MAQDWQNPTAAQSADMLKKVHAAERVTRYDSDCAIAILPLPFYGADAYLLRAQKPQAGSPAQYYTILANEAIPLDGSIENIHAGNAAAPLQLDADNIEGYLAFRLYFGSASVLQRVRAEQTGDGWQATLRAQDKSGTHEMTLLISPRGEVSESHKEQRSDDKITSLPPFASSV